MKNRTTHGTVPRDLISLLNFLQLNTLRFDKHFHTLLDILYNEKWEELPRITTATRECIKHVAKMEENLQEMERILHCLGSEG